MGAGQSKPEQVVNVHGGKLIYELESLKKVVLEEPIKHDTMVFVICISGVFRSGKSFLLNLMKTYMDYYCEHKTDCGWEDSRDTKIEGGGWATGEKTVTRGIWMYMYPQLIKNRAIILMDCQGSKDTAKSTPTLDNQLLFLGLQMADVHILNVRGTLGADDFERLGLCVYHADDKGDSESCGNLFERQMFLIRNWENAERPTQFDEKIEDAENHGVKQTLLGIKRACRKVDIEALPHPGSGVSGKSENMKITLGDVDQQFLQEAKVLFHDLVVNQASGAGISITDFLHKFQDLTERPVTKIKTPQEAYEQSLIKKVADQSVEYFKREVEMLERQQGSWTEEQMEETIERVYREAVDRFKHQKRVRDCEQKDVKMGYLADIKQLYVMTVSKKRVDISNHKVKKVEGELAKIQQELDDTKSQLKNEAAANTLAVRKDMLMEQQRAAIQASFLGNGGVSMVGAVIEGAYMAVQLLSKLAMDSDDSD